MSYAFHSTSGLTTSSNTMFFDVTRYTYADKYISFMQYAYICFVTHGLQSIALQKLALSPKITEWIRTGRIIMLCSSNIKIWSSINNPSGSGGMALPHPRVAAPRTQCCASMEQKWPHLNAQRINVTTNIMPSSGCLRPLPKYLMNSWLFECPIILDCI